MEFYFRIGECKEVYLIMGSLVVGESSLLISSQRFQAPDSVSRLHRSFFSFKYPADPPKT
jgi:hypothetical protein